MTELEERMFGHEQKEKHGHWFKKEVTTMRSSKYVNITTSSPFNPRKVCCSQVFIHKLDTTWTSPLCELSKTISLGKSNEIYYCKTSLKFEARFIPKDTHICL